MIEGDPELQKRIRELIQGASRFSEAGETKSALTLLRSAQQVAADLTSTTIRAGALLWIGQIGSEIGAWKEAESAFQQLLDCPRIDVAHDLVIPARLGLGLLYHTNKRFGEGAVQLVAASDLLAAKPDAVNLREIALRRLGECYLKLEEYQKALSALSEALPLAEELGDVQNQISLLQSIALCNIGLKKPAVARRYYERCLILAQKRKDTTTVGLTLGGLGNAHALLGQYHVALNYFRRARAYFVEGKGEGTDNALAYMDASIVKTAQSIGDELAEHVSRSIAECLAIFSDEGAKQQPRALGYPGDLKHDILCGLLSLADDLPEILPLISHVGFQELPRISTENVLRLVGEITRHTSDCESQDPGDLFQAARYIMQIRRGLQAGRLLDRIRKGEVGPDISGTGHGGYFLYLRSFVAARMMPQYRIEPWGNVDLEEILASKFDQGPWPLIALGNPEVQSFGAGKIQTDDATWQNDLTLIGKHADMIVVAPCATEGTSWEIEWVVIKNFLKKTVFVMPPSSGNCQQWWKENWETLQRWSCFLGLAFPDYVPHGLFFTVATGQQFATRSYETVLTSEDLWQTFVVELLGQFLPSDEWRVSLRDSLPIVEYQEELKARGLDSETLSQEKVKEHVERIVDRIRQIEPRLQDKVSPYILGMLEKGLPPQGAFADWPPDRRRLPSTPSLYTIWEGPMRLMWVATTLDPFVTLDSIAAGRIEDDCFCKAVLNQLVLPSLSEDLRLDVEKGLLPLDKMVKFTIRHEFSYRLIPMKINDARLSEYLIKCGVLDAGPPQLKSER